MRGDRLDCKGTDGLVPGDNPTQKPHGREAWTILFGDAGGYIDLSVMPRVTS